MRDLDIKTLSKWLEEMQRVQVDFVPDAEMLIGGGSARDILDHVLFNRPLNTRDIDIFLVKGSTVSPTRTRLFFDLLEEKGLGRLKTSVLRAKTRCNPALPKPQRYHYTVGYGAHFFRPEFPILSLSIVHTARDLELNGLLNIDKIYLRVRPDETLERFCRRILESRVSYKDLASQGFIQDQTDGYRAWVEARPLMLNWPEAERSPARIAIRITRSFAKAGWAELPVEVRERFREMVAQYPQIDDEVEFRRGFVKVFSDRYWTEELKTLAGIGVLQRISPELASKLRPVPSLDESLMNRWNAVLSRLSGREQARLRSEMEPAMASSFG
jgi:hypothetical protein